MTTEAMRAAAERIMADREFARRVYEAPESAPPIGGYDLDPAEWQAVHRALAADVAAASDEVEGYSFSWGANLDFQNVLAIGSATGGGGAGKVHVHDIVVTKQVDQSSPGSL